MENTVLRKKLQTFKTSEGRLKRVSDEVIMELLRSWEQWPGSTADLYRELGLSKMQMVILLKKGKKLVKSGVVVESEFQEIGEAVGASKANAESCGEVITVDWDSKRRIEFRRVDQVIEFLQKVS
jgi:hypothetical protein